MPDPADLITPADAAKIIGVSRPTLMKHVRRGNVGLYSHKVKRGVRFERAAVMEGRSRFRDAIFGHPADAAIPDEHKPPADAVTADDLKKYIETLKVTEGPLQGQYFHVRPWEMLILEDLANPAIRQIALTVARANGKTTFVAAIACAYFVGPFAVPRGEIDIVASKLGQAEICFDHIVEFLKERIENETYKKPGMSKPAKRFRKKKSQTKMEILDVMTGAKIQALGSDPKHAHGLAPLLCIMDEPAQWKGAGGGVSMFGALKTAFGKQKNPKALIMGTVSDDDSHWFTTELGRKTMSKTAHVYMNPKNAPDFDMESVKRANPSYDHSEVLRDDIQIAAQEARENGGNDLHQWRAFKLNKGTPLSFDVERIIEMENWAAVTKTNPEEIPPREGPVAIGIDLGGGNSMTAFAAYWPQTGRYEVSAAYPAIPDLEKRGHEDLVGNRYVEMEKRGELKLYPGEATNNIQFVKDMMADLPEDQEIIAVGRDRFKEREVNDALGSYKRAVKSESRGVGAGKDTHQDIRAFQDEVLEGTLKSGPSLLMEAAILESILVRDKSANPSLDKSRQKGKNDALQAGVIAVGIGRRWRNKKKRKKPSDFVITTR